MRIIIIVILGKLFGAEEFAKKVLYLIYPSHKNLLYSPYIHNT